MKVGAAAARTTSITSRDILMFSLYALTIFLWQQETGNKLKALQFIPNPVQMLEKNIVIISHCIVAAFCFSGGVREMEQCSYSEHMVA